MWQGVPDLQVYEWSVFPLSHSKSKDPVNYTQLAQHGLLVSGKKPGSKRKASCSQDKKGTRWHRRSNKTWSILQITSYIWHKCGTTTNTKCVLSWHQCSICQYCQCYSVFSYAFSRASTTCDRLLLLNCLCTYLLFKYTATKINENTINASLAPDNSTIPHQHTFNAASSPNEHTDTDAASILNEHPGTDAASSPIEHTDTTDFSCLPLSLSSCVHCLLPLAWPFRRPHTIIAFWQGLLFTPHHFFDFCEWMCLCSCYTHCTWLMCIDMLFHWTLNFRTKLTHAQ